MKLISISILYLNLLTLYTCVNARMKVVIDTDAGTDDAVAIFLALVSGRVEVMAITCTYGNTYETNVETNVLKVLTIANRTDIPVYAGAKQAFLQQLNITEFMGKDGLGDAEFNRPLVAKVNRTMPAAHAMVELAKCYPGEINVLTLGPLTNVATAQLIDSNFSRNVKRFYSMGARFNPPGEYEKWCKDFNFGLDPEATNLYFIAPHPTKSFILSSVILYDRRMITSEWRKDVLGKLNSKIMRFLNAIEKKMLDKLPYWSDSDSLLTALMIWPELVKATFDAQLRAVILGPSRGAVICDRGVHPDLVNAELVKDFDCQGFKNKLLEVFA